MSVNDAMERAGDPACIVGEAGMSAKRETAIAALAAIVEATFPARSVAELGAMNILATALATDELKTAACEYIEVNKVYWAALARHPARNKETQKAHRPIAERDSKTWARCVVLLKELELNELPDRRGFLIHLAQTLT